MPIVTTADIWNNLKSKKQQDEPRLHRPALTTAEVWKNLEKASLKRQEVKARLDKPALITAQIWKKNLKKQQDKT